MKFEFSLQIFEKYSNIKIHENPSSGRQVISQKDGRVDRHTHMMKLIITFHNFANSTKKERIFVPLRDVFPVCSTLPAILLTPY